MIADVLRGALEFFTDPNTEMWMKGLAALMLLLLTGFAWMLVQRIVPVLGKPLRWFRERRAWQAVAQREGWATAVTRKFSGLHDGQPWRMRAHVQGAWISDDGEEDAAPTQAQWQMKDGAWAGRVILSPKALDEAIQQRASTAAGDAANLALTAAGIVGVLTGQSWGSAALGWAGESESAPHFTSGLDARNIGSAVFQSSYVVRSDNPDLAARMITSEVESMLNDLRDDADPPNAFMLELAGSRLSMRHLGDFSDAERAARFCKLGMAVTRGIVV